jgi:DNA processing protein
MSNESLDSLRLAALSWITPAFHAGHFRHSCELLDEGLSIVDIIKNWSEKFRSIARLDPSQYFDQVSRWRDSAESLGIHLLTPLADDYPCLVQVSSAPPALLAYKGSPVWMHRDGISIVGSRKMSLQSKHWLDTHFPELLCGKESYVVSGGAEGVDQYAHVSAIRSAIPTVVVLPAGLNRFYPSEFASHENVIVEQGGAILSQFAPTQEVRKNLFHTRNRLIVSLTKTLLVVQAARRSGSYLSARLALDEGRRVGVIPGHPLDRDFSGCLDLIFDGAELIRHPRDLMWGEAGVAKLGEIDKCKL